MSTVDRALAELRHAIEIERQAHNQQVCVPLQEYVSEMKAQVREARNHAITCQRKQREAEQELQELRHDTERFRRNCNRYCTQIETLEAQVSQLKAEAAKLGAITADRQGQIE